MSCSIFGRTLRLDGPARSVTVRSFVGLSLALAMVSCTTLEPRNAPSTIRPAPARPPGQLAAVIPVLETVSSAEQQALINAINRDGQASQFNGFREPVPAPEVADGEDVVELNYEQAELRLVLEELDDHRIHGSREELEKIGRLRLRSEGLLGDALEVGHRLLEVLGVDGERQEVRERELPY